MNEYFRVVYNDLEGDEIYKDLPTKEEVDEFIDSLVEDGIIENEDDIVEIIPMKE